MTISNNNKKLDNPVHNPFDAEGTLDLPSGSEPGSVEFKPKTPFVVSSENEQPQRTESVKSESSRFGMPHLDTANDAEIDSDSVVGGSGSAEVGSHYESPTATFDPTSSDLGVDRDSAEAGGEMSEGSPEEFKQAWDRPMKIDEASHSPLTIERMRNHNVRGGSDEGAADLEALHQDGKKKSAA